MLHFRDSSKIWLKPKTKSPLRILTKLCSSLWLCLLKFMKRATGFKKVLHLNLELNKIYLDKGGFSLLLRWAGFLLAFLASRLLPFPEISFFALLASRECICALTLFLSEKSSAAFESWKTDKNILIDKKPFDYDDHQWRSQKLAWVGGTNLHYIFAKQCPIAPPWLRFWWP